MQQWQTLSPISLTLNEPRGSTSGCIGQVLTTETQRHKESQDSCLVSASLRFCPVSLPGLRVPLCFRVSVVCLFERKTEHPLTRGSFSPTPNIRSLAVPSPLPPTSAHSRFLLPYPQHPLVDTRGSFIPCLRGGFCPVDLSLINPAILLLIVAHAASLWRSVPR